MTLKTGLWSFFLACVTIWQKFLGRGEWNQEREIAIVSQNGTNLCHAIRVMVLWMPLTIAANLFAYGFALYVLTLMPIQYFGIGTFGGMTALIALVVGTIYLVAKNRIEVEDALDVVAEKASHAAGRVRERVPALGFFAALRAYAIAIKQGICPRIQPPGETAN